MNLKEAWKQVNDQLAAAAQDPAHPFRNLDFATVSKERIPRQRTVVLRGYDRSKVFTIFTDRRSQKAEHISKNPSVSLLFYHSDEKLQVSVQGTAKILTDGPEKREYWKSNGSKGAHSYTSKKAPGTIIQQSEEAFDWELDDPENFCVIKVRAQKLEFLQLSGHKHLRSYNKMENGAWHKHWIAP